MVTKSVVKTLDILETVCTADGPLDLHEISRALDLPNPTTYRLLQTLLEYGYVRQERSSRKYLAGLKIFELAHLVISRLQFADAAAAHLQQLANTTRETVHLAVLDSYEVIYLRKYESAQPITLYSRVGRRAPAYCTGVGKVLLAHLPESVLAEFLGAYHPTQFTNNTITDQKSLQVELARIREQGYAIDNMEHEDGIICIACPIKGHTGQVIAAISVTVPSFRHDLEGLMTYLPAVQGAAEKISQEVGFVEM